MVGVDFAGAMLRLGLGKVAALGLDRSIRLVRGDATRIPVASASCDATTIAFGIRNVAEPERALAEIARVLRPNGRLAILEFGQPAIPGLRSLYLVVFPLCPSRDRPPRVQAHQRLLVLASVRWDVSEPSHVLGNNRRPGLL